MAQIARSDSVAQWSFTSSHESREHSRRLNLTQIAFLFVVVAFHAHCCQAQHADTYDLTKPQLTKGETFGNIFSKTTSYRGGGIDDQSHTIGGTALYEILNPNPGNIKIHTLFRYDGRSAGEGDAEVRNSGSSNCSPTKNRCVAARDSSGPFYNIFLWGTPKAELAVGLQWSVELNNPWELGPSGTETVTVLQVEKSAGLVSLRREGQGSGFFDGEGSEITLKKDGKPCTFVMTPGPTHWSGVSVFQHGVTISDEVLETRQLALSSKECGGGTIQERQFTILVKAPSELL